MNTKQLDHTNSLKLSNKRVHSKMKVLNHLRSQLQVPKAGHSLKKSFLLRLHEMEELNTSLELLVEQRTSKLVEIVSTNGKFLSIIAHDLRSPFSSIIGILELLKLSLKEFNKERN